MAVFVTSADQMYGPITTLRRDNRLVKHIPWTAFKMTDLDWIRVVDARDILGVRTLVSMRESRLIISCSDRIRIKFRNTSPPRSNQPSGVRSLPLKNSRPLGRRSGTIQNMPCTKTLSQMVSRRLENIIQGLTRNPLLF